MLGEARSGLDRAQDARRRRRRHDAGACGPYPWHGVGAERALSSSGALKEMGARGGRRSDGDRTRGVRALYISTSTTDI